MVAINYMNVMNGENKDDVIHFNRHYANYTIVPFEGTRREDVRTVELRLNRDTDELFKLKKLFDKTTRIWDCEVTYTRRELRYSYVALAALMHDELRTVDFFAMYYAEDNHGMSLRKLKGNPFVNYENSKINYCTLVLDAADGLRDQNVTLRAVLKIRRDYNQYVEYKQQQFDSRVSTTGELRIYGRDFDDSVIIINSRM